MTLSQVIATAATAFGSHPDQKEAPVIVAAYGSIVKLSFKDSNKYAGIIDSSTLNVLLRDFSTQLLGTLIAPDVKQDNSLKKIKASDQHRSQECSVRITIFGLMSEKLAIGDLLSEGGLYLQHPSLSECDSLVTYTNPHYLLRPGSQMPSIEQLSISTSDSNQMAAESLNEVNKGRVLRIFDRAYEAASGGSLPIDQSPRLRTTLEE